MHEYMAMDWYVDMISTDHELVLHCLPSLLLYQYVGEEFMLMHYIWALTISFENNNLAIATTVAIYASSKTTGYSTSTIAS